MVIRNQMYVTSNKVHCRAAAHTSFLIIFFKPFASFANSRDLTIHNLPQSSFLSHLPYHAQKSTNSSSSTPSFAAVSVQRICILPATASHAESTLSDPGSGWELKIHPSALTNTLPKASFIPNDLLCILFFTPAYQCLRMFL